MGIPGNEGMKEVKDIFEAGSSFLTLFATMQTQIHKGITPLINNYVTFQVIGNYNHSCFFLEYPGIASPRELRFIPDFLRTACFLFFIGVILLKYRNCFCMFCNEKTEDRLSWFDQEMNSFDLGCTVSKLLYPLPGQGIERWKVETIT